MLIARTNTLVNILLATHNIVPYNIKVTPLVCFLDNSECCSQLRILRAASTHYPVLRKFLHHIYTAIMHHMYVYNIDLALRTGDYALLLQLTEIDSLETLLLDVMAVPDASTTTTTTTLRWSGLESQLQIDNAELIKCTIRRSTTLLSLYVAVVKHRKNVSKVKFTDKLGTKVCSRLKAYLLEQDPAAASKVFYMCNYCKPSLKKNTMPPRWVLNGLHVIPIPPELDRLDLLSSQLLQHAKCYQTVVRLGTYTGRVPSHNACKGNMFFLPLPLDKTLETLDQVKDTTRGVCQLYIIVNGKPTKCNIVCGAVWSMSTLSRLLSKS